MIPNRSLRWWAWATVWIVALAAFEHPAWAGISYNISVDTSGVKDLMGYIDLQLNPSEPGSTSSVIATISGFQGYQGNLEPQEPIGAVSGDLPGTVNLANRDATNSYYSKLTFGTSLQFLLNLDGPVFNQIAPSASTFLFALYDVDGNPLNQSIFPPATEPSPNVVQIDLLPASPGPGVSISINARPAYLGGDAAVVTSNAAVPEASTTVMLGLITLAGVIAARRSCRQVV